MQSENRAGDDTKPVVSDKEARYLVGKPQEEGGELSKIALDHNHHDAIKHFRGEMNNALAAGNKALAEHFAMKIEIQKKMNAPRREVWVPRLQAIIEEDRRRTQKASDIPAASVLRQEAQRKVSEALEAARRTRESAP